MATQSDYQNGFGRTTYICGLITGVVMGAMTFMDLIPTSFPVNLIGNIGVALLFFAVGMRLSRVGRPAEYVYIMLVPILSLAYAIFLIWLPDRPQPQNKKFHVLHIAAAFAIYVGIARLIQIFVYPMFI